MPKYKKNITFYSIFKLNSPKGIKPLCLAFKNSI